MNVLFFTSSCACWFEIKAIAFALTNPIEIYVIVVDFWPLLHSLNVVSKKSRMLEEAVKTYIRHLLNILISDYTQQISFIAFHTVAELKVEKIINSLNHERFSHIHGKWLIKKCPSC